MKSHQTGQHTTGARACLFFIALSLAGCAQDASEAERLSRQYGCMACHGMVRKFVGPGFAEIAARYRGDASAASRLAATIRQGGVGTWGNVIMPRQPKVTEADAKTLADWVLAQPAPD